MEYSRIGVDVLHFEPLDSSDIPIVRPTYHVSEMEHRWKYSLKVVRWAKRRIDGIKRRMGKPVAIDLADVVEVLEQYYYYQPGGMIEE